MSLFGVLFLGTIVCFLAAVESFLGRERRSAVAWAAVGVFLALCFFALLKSWNNAINKVNADYAARRAAP